MNISIYFCILTLFIIFFNLMPQALLIIIIFIVAKLLEKLPISQKLFQVSRNFVLYTNKCLENLFFSAMLPDISTTENRYFHRKEPQKCLFFTKPHIHFRITFFYLLKKDTIHIIWAIQYLLFFMLQICYTTRIMLL